MVDSMIIFYLLHNRWQSTLSAAFCESTHKYCRGRKSYQYDFEVCDTAAVLGMWNHNMGDSSGHYSTTTHNT